MKNLKEMTVKELKVIVKGKGISVSNLRKDELIKIIEDSMSVETEEIKAEVKEIIKEVKSDESNELDKYGVIINEDRDTPKELVEVNRKWKEETKIRYTCPVCGSRIYNPDSDNFCFKCGQRFAKTLN